MSLVIFLIVSPNVKSVRNCKDKLIFFSEKPNIETNKYSYIATPGILFLKIKNYHSKSTGALPSKTLSLALNRRFS